MSCLADVRTNQGSRANPGWPSASLRRSIPKGSEGEGNNASGRNTACRTKGVSDRRCVLVCLSACLFRQVHDSHPRARPDLRNPLPPPAVSVNLSRCHISRGTVPSLSLARLSQARRSHSLPDTRRKNLGTSTALTGQLRSRTPYSRRLDTPSPLVVCAVEATASATTAMLPLPFRSILRHPLFNLNGLGLLVAAAIPTPGCFGSISPGLAGGSARGCHKASHGWVLGPNMDETATRN
ncbi:hypothetical protein BO71DRAFT_114292 [Aspergillus ellipticus CBS 707.79]|uniref:Uncharacterized protein n=1 Tax=Aspergillus ellipticus CBS 707.79 TaxID=1448320 RepID=A0A319DJB6_9EURO|nr:hypothetical protein BO71DRAFT_114292 [Aspergillus ellipticus CBS 707.79]